MNKPGLRAYGALNHLPNGSTGSLVCTALEEGEARDALNYHHEVGSTTFLRALTPNNEFSSFSPIIKLNVPVIVTGTPSGTV
jgi:hypothetical protein